MRIDSFKGALLSTLVAVSISLAIPLLSPGPVHAALTSHAPIYINGDNGFTESDPVNGGGSGTLGNPYIIENWDINAENADGIWIGNTAAYFIIRNCYVHNGGDLYNGIYFENVRNGKMYGVRSENNFIGIDIYSSSNTIVENSTALNNKPGISLFDSWGNVVENCIVENNIWHGIELESHSENNIITNSTIENNSVGVWSTGGSENNRLYHNSFVNNEGQSYDEGSNYWDNGYPSGGNYWSDYTGTDNYRGGNQNIPGSDNIGDTPYYIPGNNNRDRYPLMNPWPINVGENYFYVQLLAGWNLVGFTAVGASDTPSNLFPSLTYLENFRLIRWVAPGGPYVTQPSGLVLIDNTGYWVWIDRDYTVTTSGTRPASRTENMKAGWNMVCFPVDNASTTPHNVFPGLTYLDNFRLIYWQAPGGPYKTQPEGSVLLDNTGYWVWIDRNFTITTPA